MVDVVELALLSPVAAGELGSSVSGKINWHTKELYPVNLITD